MTADNTKFDMKCVPFKPALEIAFSTSPSRKATHYKVDIVEYGSYKCPRLILAWHEDAGSDFIPLLTPMDAEMAEPWIKAWLKEQDYGNQPDHDGDNGRSFRIYNGSWGYVDGIHYTFAAVEPEWAEYGK